MYHKHGGDIYSYGQIRDFSANINERGMPDAVRRAAEQAIQASIHYPDPAYRTLRRALAVREKTEAGRIVCGNGAAELMFALAAAQRPEKAFLAVPSFFEYEQALSAFGCEICRHVLREEAGFAVEEDLPEKIPEGTDIIILGNPNNPTGQPVPRAILRRILEVCRDRAVFLVLDESFLDFLTEEDLNKTMAGTEALSGTERMLILKSFTKMYGMPGLRFGYGICGDPALTESLRERMQPWNVSVPAQMAAEAAAAELDFARETAVRTARNRSVMKRQMEECGYRVYDSCANFLLFRDEREAAFCKEAPCTDGVSPQQASAAGGSVLPQQSLAAGGPESLQQFCLERGFLIRDCSNFPGLTKGYYRVCVRSREENELLLKVLRQAAEREPRRG